MTIIAWAQSPIKALIITGQNNHAWQISTPILWEMMNRSGLFTVDIATTPPQGSPMDHYLIDFKPYDLVVLDYVGDSWPKATNEAFLAYVENGGGVVVYHAADNAFPQWKEYNEIIALGGWLGRNQASGPYAYWKDGALFKDYETPGTGGNHGERRTYPVNCRDTNHPITKGLPSVWMHATDELYDMMRGPANIETVLYTGYSTITKRDEPLIFTVRYGKGRIFHTMLGHIYENQPLDAVRCVGFRTTFLRGAEWAATGKVTQVIPKNFPSATEAQMVEE